MSILDGHSRGCVLEPPIPPPVSDLEQDVAKQADFRSYIKRVYPEYRFYRWCDHLIEHLQYVADGEIKRLIITVPPRHGKTETASRLFPAYFLSRHPTRWVGLATYDRGLSFGMSREARRYYRIGGGVLAADSQNVSMWQTWANGGLWAIPVGGSATGKGGHLLIIDDPIKGQREADRPTNRRFVHAWYTPTFLSREEPGGAQILIGTRWHKMDLHGFVLNLEEESDKKQHWFILDLPAIAEAPHQRPVYPETCTVLPDWREPGEVLCPERYDLPALQSFKASMQPRHWDAIYQCRPTAAEGTIFKREWLNWYQPDEPLPKFNRIIMSLDATFKDREDSDFVAFTIWGQHGSDYWLLDGVRDRMDFNRTLAVLLNLGKQWRPSATLIEDTANGPAIISTLKQKWPNLVAVSPDGSKEARAYAAQPVFLAGRVILPNEAPFLSAYLAEIISYPAGENDDYVDSTSQAIRWLENIGQVQVTQTQWGRGIPQQAQQPALRWNWASPPAPGQPGPGQVAGRKPASGASGWGRWGG